MASTSSSSSRPVEAIFKDYTARRTALIRALTIDVEKLYSLCAPEKEHLCLYGHPNESWEVTLPPEEVPSEIPEPVLGINFARDDLSRRDWLSLVAVHSDCWLLSVAFCLGGRLKRKERKQLFTLTNNLPTLYEIVTGQKPAKDKPTTDNGSKSQSGSKRSNEGHIKSNSKQLNESNGEDGEERGDTLCGSCGRNYNSDEFWICCGVCERWYHGECVKITRENFWICCDVCERWYHGECVKITPENAESIMQYECSSCNNTKRARQKMPILD